MFILIFTLFLCKLFHDTMQKRKITELNRISVEEFQSKTKLPLVVILDNIRSLHNIGAIFRTCDAFLIEEIYLCGITATPPNAEIHKTALGAENTVKWVYFESIMDAIRQLQTKGYAVFAVEQVKQSIPLNELKIDVTKKYAIIVGNEVKGVQQVAVDMCNGAIEIPQFGTKHSLNVSIAAGIVIWDLVKELSTSQSERG